MEIKGKQQYKFSSTKIPYGSILWLILIRLVIIPLLNYDYPDQYWQGPQIAYKIYNRLVNSKDIGYETWQWTMEDPIRNPIYQFILSLGYMGAHLIINAIKYIEEHHGYQLGHQLLSFDTIMQFGPKLVQMFLAIVGDIYAVKLAYFYFGKQKITTFSIIFILSNWFYFSMLSRTYINSFQCVLMSISFYYWQVDYSHNIAIISKGKQTQLLSRKDFISRMLVLIAYVARPTSLIPWMIIWPFELLSYLYQGIFLLIQVYFSSFIKGILIQINKSQAHVSKIQKYLYFLNHFDKRLSAKMIAKNLIHIIFMILSSLIIGSLYFNKLILTEWNFLYVIINLNLIEWANFFGVHPWYFYFVITLPLIIGGYLVFFLVGFCIEIKKSNSVFDQTQSAKKQQYDNLCWMSLLFLIITTLISGHKENRFLMIYMPFFMMIVFGGYIKLRQLLWNSVQNKFTKKLFFILLIMIIVISNISMLGTVALYSKGGVNILRKIRTQIDYRQNTKLNKNTQKIRDNKIRLMYLSDAHALPAHSIILRNIDLVLPDESPQAKLKNRSETELLKTNPYKAYNTMIGKLSEQMGIDFMIVQHKYCNNVWVDDLKQESEKVKEMKKGILTGECDFIQKNFEWVMTSNNRNLWEQMIYGPDFLYLYVNKRFRQS